MDKKVTPFNSQAEQFILGAVFLKPSLIQNLHDVMSLTDFYLERHQLIFQAMINVFNSGIAIDYSTITNELNNQATLAQAGGVEYLSAIADSVPSVSNVNAYIRIVKDLSLKRSIIETSKAIMDKGYDSSMSSTDYVDMAENKLFEVTKKRQTSSFATLNNIAKKVLEQTEDKMKNKGEATGLVTDYYKLDKITLGLHPEQLIILAARPSMGKSALAMNIAVNVAKKNKEGKASVAVFSLEMAADQIVSRLISCEAGIESTKIRSGYLDPKEWRQFEAGIDSLSRLNIFFDDSSMITIGDIRAKCRKLRQEDSLDLIIIDYLQLIQGDGSRNNRQEEVANISRSLKQLARELKIPIIALAQLSRDVEKREDKKPIMADLRESGSIEQDADVVLFIYRDDYYTKENSKKPGTAEIIVAKNRSGASGDDIQLLFQPSFSRFRNMIEEEIEEE